MTPYYTDPANGVLLLTLSEPGTVNLSALADMEWRDALGKAVKQAKTKFAERERFPLFEPKELRQRELLT